MRHWRKRQTEVEEVATTLVDEASAFLSGSYPAPEDTEPTVPCWTWLARLAHGSPEMLGALADPSDDQMVRPELLPWWRAMRALSSALLRTANDTSEELIDLQRRVLVPLELRLTGVQYGPATLVREVACALARATDRA